MEVLHWVNKIKRIDIVYIHGANSHAPPLFSSLAGHFDNFANAVLHKTANLPHSSVKWYYESGECLCSAPLRRPIHMEWVDQLRGIPSPSRGVAAQIGPEQQQIKGPVNFVNWPNWDRGKAKAEQTHKDRRHRIWEAAESQEKDGGRGDQPTQGSVSLYNPGGENLVYGIS